MGDVLWLKPRAPGDQAARVRDDLDNCHDAVVFGDLYETADWVIIPAPFKWAGERHRVTRKFYGPDPYTGEGRVAHMWIEPIGLGFAESTDIGGFPVYAIDSYPDRWPRKREMVSLGADGGWRNVAGDTPAG